MKSSYDNNSNTTASSLPAGFGISNSSSTNNNSSEYYRQVHRILVERVPELNSTFTPTPMAYDRWRRPDETVDDGQPCFLARDDDDDNNHDNHDATTTTTPPRKPDYIFVAKPSNRKVLQPGYYHLRTAEAHKEVYRRFCAQPRRNARRLQQQSRGTTTMNPRFTDRYDKDDDDQSIYTTTTAATGPYDKVDHEELQSSYLNIPTTAKLTTTTARNDVRRDERYYYKEAKRILWNRTWAEEPDDLLAQRMALVNTQSQGSVNTSWAKAARMPVLVGSLLVGLGGAR
ncbi:hypothetical protein ACA910_008051 [Epithemia clementina (nom. ined.)]